MEHRFDVHLTAVDASTALRRFMLRSAGPGVAFVVVLCLACASFDASRGGVSMLGTIVIAVMLMLLTVFVMAYAMRARQTRDVLARMGDDPVAYRFSDTEIETSSTFGTSALEWKVVRTVWVDRDLVLPFYGKGVYTTIPLGQIPDEALEFLLDKVRAGGGEIVDRRKAG